MNDFYEFVAKFLKLILHYILQKAGFDVEWIYFEMNHSSSLRGKRTIV